MTPPALPPANGAYDVGNVQIRDMNDDGRFNAGVDLLLYGKDFDPRSAGAAPSVPGRPESPAESDVRAYLGSLGIKLSNFSSLSQLACCANERLARKAALQGDMAQTRKWLEKARSYSASDSFESYAETLLFASAIAFLTLSKESQSAQSKLLKIEDLRVFKRVENVLPSTPAAHASYVSLRNGLHHAFVTQQMDRAEIAAKNCDRPALGAALAGVFEASEMVGLRSDSERVKGILRIADRRECP